MRLLLITASSPEIKKIRKSRFLNFQQITMPFLAALTPPHWDITHIDEEVNEIDFNKEYDLVAITFHTPSAYHAYEISAKFRIKKIPVALGGPHVTLIPEEAKEHADVIFIGEAEETWPEFIKDFEKKTIRQYMNKKSHHLWRVSPFQKKIYFTEKTIQQELCFQHEVVQINASFVLYI